RVLGCAPAARPDGGVARGRGRRSPSRLAVLDRRRGGCSVARLRAFAGEPRRPEASRRRVLHGERRDQRRVLRVRTGRSGDLAELEPARTPGPVVALLTKTGTDGVVHHVETDLLEFVLVERPAPEAVAEEVAPASVFAVESLGVVTVEDLHAVGEIHLCRVEYEVIVVRHQAERLTRPLVVLDHEYEEAEEVSPIVVVAVDRHLCDPASRNVKEPVREDRSRNSRHHASL